MRPDEESIISSLAGCRIKSAKYWTKNNEPLDTGEGVLLTLDDGRLIEISSWGHDWHGVCVEEVRPA